MDILLYFYSFIFLIIIITPSIFLVLSYKENSVSPFGDTPDEAILNLEGERQILISNLADLKAEQETGKMKEGEFREYSKDILTRLSEIDTNIQLNKNKEAIQSTASSNSSPTTEAQESLNISQATNRTTVINFCPSCGTKALEKAAFCHSCGFKLPIA